jgi:hypothetical protein
MPTSLPIVGLAGFARSQVEKENQLQQRVESIIGRADDALAIARDTQALDKIDNLVPRFSCCNDSTEEL